MFPRRVIFALRLLMLACIGAWLLFIGICIAFGVPGLMKLTVVNPLYLIAIGWIPAVIVWLVLIAYGQRVRAQVKEMDYLMCPKCGYDLRGCDSFGACPECGRAYARDKLPLDWHRGGFAPREVFWKFYRKRRHNS